MERAYAQALWQMIESGMEPTQAVRSIHTQLKAKGREALMPRIAKAFERLAARESTHTAVTLTVADKAHEHTVLTAALAALKGSEIQPGDVHVHVDDNLIGGWRIEGREQLVDASYKKHLLAIYNLATH